MRRTIIAANWKMHKDLDESIALVNDLKTHLASLPGNVDVILCPPFPSLALVASLIKGTPFRLGAQNMSEHDEGAYTGEVSWRMLKSAGCDSVILGHSERRQYFAETNALINLKARKALANELRPIICVGEKLEEREQGITMQIVTAQVKGTLHGIGADELDRVVLAYEPVWAIGTGRTATPLQAQEVHRAIRKLVGQLYDWAHADRLIIQYGGSVKPDNAADLLLQDDIDGALVGGACLKADSFAAIINAAKG